MADVYPLFLDGPLKGRELGVPSAALRGGGLTAVDAALTPNLEPPLFNELVTYHFTRYRLLGVVMWVGSTTVWDARPEADLLATLAEQVFSERAGKAVDHG